MFFFLLLLLFFFYGYNVDLLSGPPLRATGPQDLPAGLQGELPCDIFYLNEDSGSLQTFKVRLGRRSVDFSD